MAIDNRYAFGMGAAPGHLLAPARREQLLAPDERWGVVAIEMDRIPPVDWTQERECRLAGDLPFEARYFSALVASRRDAAIFGDFARHPPRAGASPLDALLGSTA